MNTTKNIKSQTKNEYKTNLAKRFKFDYKTYLKRTTKKEYLKTLSEIKFTINEKNQIDVVFVNSETIDNIKKYAVVVEMPNITNNQLKKLIIENFISCNIKDFTTTEKQKDFNILSFEMTQKAYQFYKNINYDLYMFDKVLEYNKLTKQYQTRNK